MAPLLPRLLQFSQGRARRLIFAQSRPILLPRQFSRPAFTAAAKASSLVTRLKNLLYGTSISLFALFSYLYITDTRASVHQWLVVPTLRWVYPDAEDAHHTGTKALKALYSLNLHPRERPSKKDAADLSVVVYGQKLQNPIGTSAGIDKLAEVPDALFALGPAIVEVGGTTPLPQEGNPKPRVFRLPSRNSMINRYGLNSKGADDMARTLRERVRAFAYRSGYGIGDDAEKFVLNGGAGVPPGSLTEGKMLLVQVAKNKETRGDDIEAVKRDYVYCVERLAPYADILVVNVSSPNTPGLRTLQRVEPLTRILEGVVEAAKSAKRKSPPKVMVKVSPDEDQDEQIEGIVEAIWKSGVDGIIVGNTTNRRDNILPKDLALTAKESSILGEKGGLSGPHMFERTLGLVKRYRQLLDQGPPLEPKPKESTPAKPVGSLLPGDEPGANITKKPESTKEVVTSAVSAVVSGVKDTISSKPHEQKVIFATGGITNGKQALEILNAGASVAQVYTALVYGGSGTITRIKREMKEEIERR
ncbi:Dihydroorotate dehydrogenase (quinone), mitochondrial [Cadophora gregata]|uniref:Dihydroorotate dehydrogenase (quinone), mitochondrial n=1 Tax=Cadophora gregata TaxID=51156 RepID=UPI0026DABBE3|nr:Dihydroorotate dehydrogenase (quinone), mitochondrial [Cadophora gregata]KAK0099819.1 Dihydroorotate dehydrogenase (quinone), mitochondrial [Cadophora gregata]KAK0123585.1 Dihydroorotate dehydrogenase (quinone), mitochondrial [Cadophora gregata f. sp. sojae]